MEQDRTEEQYRDQNGEMRDYVPPRYKYSYKYKMMIGINSPWFDDMDFQLHNFDIDANDRGKIMAVEQIGNQIIAALSGGNMAGNCIIDDEVCKEASKQEIIRRYYQSLNRYIKDEASGDEIYKQELIMKQAKISVNDRAVVPIANERAKQKGSAAAAMELPDGTIVTGSTSDLLGPASAVLLNAIKVLGKIDDNEHLISPSFIEPIQHLKTGYLGSKNPRLHTDEVLIALSMCAVSDPKAKLALEQLPKLSGCQLHVSAILSSIDINTFKKLGIELTNEAVYEGVATTETE